MMPRYHARCAILIILALVAHPIPPLSAQPSKQQPDLAAFWRDFFQRPAPDNQTAPSTKTRRARVALGAKLFRDTRLSGANNRACISCHRPSSGFTSNQPTAIGLDGKPLERNIPSLWNLKWATRFHWDGRASSLETQAPIPIEHPSEMAGRWPDIIERLANDKTTTAAFASAFPGKEPLTPTRDKIVKALAAFQRTLVSPKTRFDQFIGGDTKALTSTEHQGFRLFVGRAGCVACHAGWRFTDNSFHDIGLKGNDPGRGALPGMPNGPAFKTPSLRELTTTWPYMHDGSLKTLDDVLEHYTSGITNRPGISSKLTRPLKLSTIERTNLIAFLKTLSKHPPTHP